MAEPTPDQAFEAAQREFLRMANDLQRQFDGRPTPHCSFCERSQDEVAAMIEGARAWICDACVNEAMTLLNQR